jgi:hypothetical protein
MYKQIDRQEQGVLFYKLLNMFQICSPFQVVSLVISTVQNNLDPRSNLMKDSEIGFDTS